MSASQAPEKWVGQMLREGVAIPAHPLALTDAGKFDERHQRALTRYYAAAGAGGVAVGVHTTQFAIREPGVDLLEPVLACAAAALDEIERGGGAKLVRIAGVCGDTTQATAEAALARSLGYHVGLVSLAALSRDDDDELISHCRAVAEVIPVMGFYLQRAIGGRRLGFDFWRRFAEIPSAVAIKMSPFNRYETIDVIRGVAASGRAGRVALYTGNDDNIVADLLTRFDFHPDDDPIGQWIVGGLLGHWAVWTHPAVRLHRQLRQAADSGEPIEPDLLALGPHVTDANAALFDVANDFAGCTAGVQHVLAGQGLLASPRCLDPAETLSPGQADEIDRVRRQHPHLIDDDFVAEHLDEWLS